MNAALFQCNQEVNNGMGFQRQAGQRMLLIYNLKQVIVSQTSDSSVKSGWAQNKVYQRSADCKAHGASLRQVDAKSHTAV